MRSPEPLPLRKNGSKIFLQIAFPDAVALIGNRQKPARTFAPECDRDTATGGRMANGIAHDVFQGAIEEFLASHNIDMLRQSMSTVQPLASASNWASTAICATTSWRSTSSAKLPVMPASRTRQRQQFADQFVHAPHVALDALDKLAGTLGLLLHQVGSRLQASQRRA